MAKVQRKAKTTRQLVREKAQRRGDRQRRLEKAYDEVGRPPCKRCVIAAAN